MVEGTRIKALREAKGLLQSFGFNGFSFQHLADKLGIKKPSLYDHFASKEALGLEIIAEYKKSFLVWAETIDSFAPKDKIGALFELFFKFLSHDSKVCPMSALIGDFNSLPTSMKKSLRKMFDAQEDWINKVIQQGQKQKLIRRDLSSAKLTSMMMSMALGAQLMARVSGNPEILKQLKADALKTLEPGE